MALHDDLAATDDGDVSNEVTVGFDGSAESSHAVVWAASEARLRGVRLRIVHCFEMPIAVDRVYGLGGRDAFEEAMESAEQTLSSERAQIAKLHPGLELVSEAVAGPPGQVLVGRVDANDLIVVGSSSHKHAAAFWLGSTPRYVVRHSPCPVVVVRGSVESSRPRRVLVGVDGSPESQHAMHWAGEEADRHGVNLVLVHAWSYAYTPRDASPSQAHDLTEVDAACLLEAEIESARAVRCRCRRSAGRKQSRRCAARDRGRAGSARRRLAGTGAGQGRSVRVDGEQRSRRKFGTGRCDAAFTA